MSTEAIPNPSALASGDGTNTAAVPTVGIDPLYSDCVLRSTSGGLYYTLSGVFAACSPVFRDLIECCGQKHKPSSELDSEDDSVVPKSKRVCTRQITEIPLEDPEEQIVALVELLHQPDRFWASVIPAITEEGRARIVHLTPIAFKYDMQGVLRQITTVMESPELLTEFISHDDLMATWAFACKYRLENVVREVEERIVSGPLTMANGLPRATRVAATLPSSSPDLAVQSLVRMLHSTSRSYVKLAMALWENGDVISSALAKADSNGHYSRRLALQLALRDVAKSLAV